MIHWLVLNSPLTCLVSGKVKIYKDGVGGRPQIMRVLGETEYFAYRAYMARSAKPAVEGSTPSISSNFEDFRVIPEVLLFTGFR